MWKPARTFMLAMAAAIVLIQSSPLQAIGPSVLMFYGAPLKAPVYVTGADAALFPNVLQDARLAGNDFSARPFITVAIFWDTQANPSLAVLAALTPERAWQHGRFYLSTPTLPAVLLTTQFNKKVAAQVPEAGSGGFTEGGPVSPQALEALKRLGVPTTAKASR